MRAKSRRRSETHPVKSRKHAHGGGENDQNRGHQQRGPHFAQHVGLAFRHLADGADFGRGQGLSEALDDGADLLRRTCRRDRTRAILRSCSPAILQWSTVRRPSRGRAPFRKRPMNSSSRLNAYEIPLVQQRLVRVVGEDDQLVVDVVRAQQLHQAGRLRELDVAVVVSLDRAAPATSRCRSPRSSTTRTRRCPDRASCPTGARRRGRRRP